MNYFPVKENIYNELSITRNFSIWFQDTINKTKFEWNDYITNKKGNITLNYSIYIFPKSSPINSICQMSLIPPNISLINQNKYEINLDKGKYKMSIIASIINKDFPLTTYYDFIEFTIPKKYNIELIAIFCSFGLIIIIATIFLIIYCKKRQKDDIDDLIDEVFIENPENKSYIFKAIELSDISGIYVKVIADYTEQSLVNEEEFEEEGEELEIADEESVDGEENGDVPEDEVIQHFAGEELFITGKDQMIYYPRPEHAIISYEGKIVHHAIAIPEGEGRYVLNRLSGDVKMVRGPIMYLPDPRYEVIVKRKLTKKQCKLWYPNNSEVLDYNVGIEEYSPQTLSLDAVDLRTPLRQSLTASDRKSVV